ncbi:MAG: catechol 1,2-dioxygenase [Bacteroidetes bacterium]|nr:MAG: catechol 1,2-dioxygenase [Bacteroidota bacterium]
MKRRTFMRDSSLVAMSIGVFGKIKWNGNSYTGEDATTTDILGPFYRPGAPVRTDLVQKGSSGEVIHVCGIIFAKDGKTPVKDALIEIWHCNENGVYDNTSDDYNYRASFKTGGDGKYHFRTILPVPYKAGPTSTRPAHFHFRISGSGEQDLVTQVYFKGDKYIPGDGCSADPRALNRILDISKNADNEKMVTFNIVLKDTYQLSDAAYEKLSGVYRVSDDGGRMAEFYKMGNELFLKMNGHIVEAMEYKGNNSFEGGMGLMKAQFDLTEPEKVKVKITYEYDGKIQTSMEGYKYMKYSS